MVEKRQFKAITSSMLEQEELSCISFCFRTRVELHVDLWVWDPFLQQLEVTNCYLGSWALGFDPTQ
eukprot:2213996-Prorocentrum_lima.AAC.1